MSGLLHFDTTKKGLGEWADCVVGFLLVLLFLSYFVLPFDVITNDDWSTIIMVTTVKVLTLCHTDERASAGFHEVLFSLN